MSYKFDVDYIFYLVNIFPTISKNKKYQLEYKVSEEILKLLCTAYQFNYNLRLDANIIFYFICLLIPTVLKKIATKQMEFSSPSDWCVK